MTTLLNIDANPKTIKGQERGYMTAVLYLAPYKASGVNLCPTAELAGCWEGCLNTAGRGGIAKRGDVIATDAGALPDNAIQRARLERTRIFNEDRGAFLAQLTREIRAFVRKAERADLTPAVRLNGTSDIEWERVAPELFETFADVQFYDYTKLPKRFKRTLPDNYYLALSYSEASERYAEMCRAAKEEHGASLVKVIRTKAEKARQLALLTSEGAPVVDGDAHDLRFLDVPGAMVLLTAKGRARNDRTGFVLG